MAASVLQSSVLEAILFSVYVDDVMKELRVKLLLFVVDTQYTFYNAESSANYAVARLQQLHSYVKRTDNWKAKSVLSRAS